MKFDKRMNKLFYSHLVDLQDLEKLLSHESVDENDRTTLLATAHETIHIEVVHFILNNIPHHERHMFLKYVETKPHDDGLWVYVNKSIDDAESKLTRLITQVKQDFIDALDDYMKSSEEWFTGQVEK